MARGGGTPDLRITPNRFKYRFNIDAALNVA
jgi:hypothetical protein